MKEYLEPWAKTQLSYDYKKSRIKATGLAKAALGGFATFGFPVSLGVGLMVAGVAFKGFIFGSICRGIGWLTGWKGLGKFGKNMQNMGIKACLAGLAVTNPFTGAALLAEGTYELTQGKQAKYGFGTLDYFLSKGVTGLPQFGDNNYDHRMPFWQDDKRPRLPDDYEYQNQQNNTQTPSPEISEHAPVTNIDSVKDISNKVKKAKTYEEAQNEFKEATNSMDSSQKLVPDMKTFKKYDDGNYEVTYYHPKDKNTKVIQKFDKDGHLIEVKPANEKNATNAEYLTAPVLESGKYVMYKHDTEGKLKNVDKEYQKPVARPRVETGAVTIPSRYRNSSNVLEL